MTKNPKNTILYIHPSDAQRTAIVEYADHFTQALQLVGTVQDVLPANLPERIDSSQDRNSVKLFVKQFAQEYARHDALFVHVEIGNALHREFWAGYYLQQALPHARFFCTLHDPPRLTSNPFRYVHTEFAGRTPFRLLDVGLTWTAERIVQWRKTRVEQKFLKRCNGIAALTHAGVDLLKNRMPDLSTQIQHLNHVTIASSDSRKSNDNSSHDIVIGFFGFLAPSKGIETLLDAYDLTMERLAEKGPSARLLLFGGIAQGFQAESFVAKLRERIANSPWRKKINFSPGFVSQEEKDTRLDQTDIIVLPYRSVRETVFSSASLIHSLSRGKAVVVSRTNTVMEEVNDGVNGLLYPEGDATALSECLYRLVQDQALRARLGKAARHHIESNHLPDKVAQDIRLLYGLGSA